MEECKQLTRLALQSSDMDSVALGGCPSLNQLTLCCPSLQMLDLQYAPCCRCPYTRRAVHAMPTVSHCPCCTPFWSNAWEAGGLILDRRCMPRDASMLDHAGLWRLVCQGAASGPELRLLSPPPCRITPQSNTTKRSSKPWTLPAHLTPMTRLGMCRGCGDLEMVQGSCPRLHTVDAQFCHVLGNQALDSMAACMPALQSLLLPYCTAIACTGLAALAAMQGLHTLDLSFSNLKVDGSLKHKCSMCCPCLASWQSSTCVPARAWGAMLPLRCHRTSGP